MKRKEDFDCLIGQQFNYLTLEEVVGRKKNRWIGLFSCVCGNKIEKRISHVTSGSTKSCSCMRPKLLSDKRKRETTHGMTNTREYKSWRAMKARCTNQNLPSYKDYGGRGIKICDEWINSFENFYNDMGKRPDNTSLDRINYNGNYEPQNCRWADDITQRNNQRSNIPEAIRKQIIELHAKDVPMKEITRQVGHDAWGFLKYNGYI